MSRKVVQFKNIGSVTFSRNTRSKSIKISVKPDKSVLVSYPFFVVTKEVVAFVEKNTTWIKQQQNKFNAKKNTISDGTQIQTRLHLVNFRASDKTATSINESIINVTVNDFDSEVSQIYIENILVEIYRFEAKKILPVKLEKLAFQFGFKYNNVTIRNNKRNWGSCSSKNNISLNLQMMRLPDELIDYILLHELVHTEIKNHGPKFWERLNELSGGRARELAKEVRKFSTYTL